MSQKNLETFSESRLACRLQQITESLTLKLNASVQALQAAGVDIVNLTAGEPDFWAPPEAKEGVIEAVHANRSHYTAVPGIPELRSAIARKTNGDQPGLAHPWSGAHVVVSNGAKQALFNTLMALVNPGERVLMAAPYWLSYPEMVRLVGGVPAIIPTHLDAQFKITPEALRQALSSAGPPIRAVILNSPANPTGAVSSKTEYQQLGEVLLEAEGLPWIFSDEIYDRITLDEIPFCSFLGAVPELASRTVTLNGLSKTAAMTGWRVGWSVAPLDLTQGIITLQGQTTSGICSLAQYGALAALGRPPEAFAFQLDEYRKRRKVLVEGLRGVDGLEWMAPQGAFYAWLGVKVFARADEDSVQMAERILEKTRVAVVPGTPFGAPHHIRLSIATQLDTLQEGVRRLRSYFLATD